MKFPAHIFGFVFCDQVRSISTQIGYVRVLDASGAESTQVHSVSQLIELINLNKNFSEILIFFSLSATEKTTGQAFSLTVSFCTFVDVNLTVRMGSFWRTLHSSSPCTICNVADDS
jgi:hypothetical protein